MLCSEPWGLAMRRREFITLVGGAAAWPLAARAQQLAKQRTIGFLGSSTPLAMSQWVAAFVQRLRDLGWIEGRTVTIEYRWAEGRSSRAVEIAAEFVRLKVDVIVTYATSPVLAPKQATSVIPIVFAAANDPVGAGLVASLARPGGNVTGLSVQQADIAGKRLELLREVVPGLRRLAIIANAGLADAALEIDELQTTARTLGLEVAIFEIRRAEDIAPAFEALKNQADALYVVVDALVTANRTRIITFALTARLPMMLNTRDHVQAGALISYGPNFPTLFRRAAEYVDKIRHEARRNPGRAADQIRTGCQSHDRQGTWADHPGVVSAAHRRGDRVNRREFITLLGGVSPLRNSRLAVILFAASLIILWGNAAMAMTLKSPAFQQNGHIPSKYTCEGEDVSPPLAWEDAPQRR